MVEKIINIGNSYIFIFRSSLLDTNIINEAMEPISIITFSTSENSSTIKLFRKAD